MLKKSVNYRGRPWFASQYSQPPERLLVENILIVPQNNHIRRRDTGSVPIHQGNFLQSANMIRMTVGGQIATDIQNTQSQIVGAKGPWVPQSIKT